MKKNILITPLNWGLGHATRCIPIIKALEENNFTPIIASDGVALALLKSILQRKYFSDFYRTIYPVKLIPKEKYRLFKIVVIDDKVYKYDLDKTYGPGSTIR